jgi:hypothetical protein
MSNPWGNYTTSRQLPVFSNFPGISGELSLTEDEKVILSAITKTNYM